MPYACIHFSTRDNGDVGGGARLRKRAENRRRDFEPIDIKCDIAPDRIPKHIPTLPLNRINGRFYRRDQGGQMAG
jgi:hypothetical protein